MSIALPCPHCETARIETANTVWHIKGFLLFSSHGSKTILGCNDCVRSKTLQSLAVSGVMGWWCFPWGLGTPFVLLQNLVAWSGTNDPGPLRGVLSDNGYDYDDLVVGADGRSAGDRRMINTILHILHTMTWADGEADPREIATGSAVLASMLGSELIDVDEAQNVLGQRTPPPEGDIDRLGPDAQIMVMKAACAIAAADDVIEESEVKALRALGRRLHLDPAFVEPMVGALGDVNAAAVDPEALAMRREAASILGVPADAPLGMLRNAYQSKVMEATHTHDDPAEREEALLVYKSAYDVLLEA